jgi:hypothetical protein
MSPVGEWVNVQGVNTGGSEGVRTLRYADAGIPGALPGDVAQALRGGALTTSTARIAAGAPLTTANVVEASRKLDSAVVAAWIMDRGQRFGLDARQVVALADAGVPGNVTDAMVAVSYPDAFVVAQPSGDASGVATIESASGVSGGGVERAGGRDVQVLMVPGYSRYDYSPFGYSPFDYYGYGYSRYGYSPYGYSPYGYSPYGYLPYSRFYSPYGGYGTYGGVYSPPVIILKGNQPAQRRGYAVKGRGYTETAPRRNGSSGTTAAPRPTVSSPSSSSGTSAQPSQPSQPSSSGRTAHQRP